MDILPVHVLLVEDNATDAELIRRALSSGLRGMQVAHADTVAGARHYMAHNAVDVVLLDLGLPDSIGLETVREMRVHAPHAPIVVTTGRDDLSIGAVIEVGAQDILVKSNLNSDSITRCIRHALQRKQAEDAISAAHAELARKHGELEEINRQLRTEIAERIRIEVQLERAREQAVAANHAKTDFLACMSHELRTPLNAIIGFSEGILGRIDQHPLNDHQRDRLMRIRDAGQHLLRLINDILDVSRIEAGMLRIDATRFAPVDLMQEIVDLVDPLRRDKAGIRLVVDVANDLPELESDRGKLKQILLNLLSNAFKFTDAGSVTMTVARGEDTVAFAVSDTGAGIPAHMLEAVFEKFQQVDTSARRSRGGTGLGLAICRQFTQLLGGTLTVQSELGVGSTFTLRIPVYAESIVIEPADASAEAVASCWGGAI